MDCWLLNESTFQKNNCLDDHCPGFMSSTNYLIVITSEDISQEYHTYTRNKTTTSCIVATNIIGGAAINSPVNVVIYDAKINNI